jgi:hypothetical protein
MDGDLERIGPGNVAAERGRRGGDAPASTQAESIGIDTGKCAD